MVHTKVTKEFLEGILGFEIEGFTVDYYGINVYGQLKNPLKQVKAKENSSNDSKRVEDGITVWSIVKEYINSLPIYSTITKYDLYEAVHKKRRGYSLATINRYRNMLLKAGYLYPAVVDGYQRDGIYSVYRRIEEWLTSTNLRNLCEIGEYTTN